jgi:hypothetical protein
MTWSFKAAGHCPLDDANAQADVEKTIMAHLSNILADPRFGLSASQFTGTYAAGTPGLPEPEPVPAEEYKAPEEPSADELAEFRAWQQKKHPRLAPGKASLFTPVT